MNELLFHIMLSFFQAQIDCRLQKLAAHCQLCLQLKGSADIDGAINYFVGLLNLGEKRDKEAKTLSGGQKRKLCVGIALIGGSKVGASSAAAGSSLTVSVTIARS